jgi:hypothetical protein
MAVPRSALTLYKSCVRCATMVPRCSVPLSPRSFPRLLLLRRALNDAVGVGSGSLVGVWESSNPAARSCSGSGWGSL